MIVRFERDGEVRFGVLQDEEISVINGDIFSDYEVTNEKVSKNEVKLLAPTEPSKVVCIGLNYVDHAKELNLTLPKEPLMFIKPSTSVIGPNDDVVYPEVSSRVEYEAELAIVIGKRAKNVPKEEVNNYILGYTVANDVTARDIQFSDGQWTRGKSFDTFCPIGPGIVKDVDPNQLSIELSVDGVVKQKSNTNQLLFKVDEIVSYVSKMMTLLPGDVIITGTPFGVGPVEKGNTMTVTIEKIGKIVNKVI